ncbi:MAG: ferredoxin family protein [Burkholderiales bacterium]|nr:ferredoxin family protein [Burkholderiales bacterium]
MAPYVRELTGPNMLVIDPDECIDCALCIPECPVGAIVGEEDVPAGQQTLVTLNAELAQVWPAITKPRKPLGEAEQWKEILGKLQYLER